jgi:hypothetical protein
MRFKYGRLPRDFSKYAPTLENYLSAAGLPSAPLCIDRASKVASWPMYMNGPDPANPPASPDGIEDCTCAAPGHIVQGWTAYAGTGVTLPDSAILTAYEAVSGYNPATGANDNGAEMADVCAYWQKTGFGTHKLAGYAALGDPTDIALLGQILNTFGTVYVGINCPESAQTQFGDIWTYSPGSPIEGGHAICLQQTVTDQMGCLHFVTWGALQKAEVAFVEHYVEEAWCVVSEDWIDANGTTIEGLDLTQLIADSQDV